MWLVLKPPVATGSQLLLLLNALLFPHGFPPFPSNWIMAAGRDSRSWKFLSSWEMLTMLVLYGMNKIQQLEACNNFQPMGTYTNIVQPTEVTKNIAFIEVKTVEFWKNIINSVPSEACWMMNIYTFSKLLFPWCLEVSLSCWTGVERWDLRAPGSLNAVSYTLLGSKNLSNHLYSITSKHKKAHILLQQIEYPTKGNIRSLNLCIKKQSVTLRSHGVFRRFFILQDSRNRLHLPTEPFLHQALLRKMIGKLGKELSFL